MPLSLTYATLTSQIQDHLGDTGTDLSDQIPTIIALAETQTLKDMDLEIFDLLSNSIVFTQGDPVVVKPADLISTRSLRFSTTSDLLLPKSYEYLIDYWPNAASTGTPLYYTELSDTQWLVAPTPSAGSASGSSRYMKRPAGLSGSVSSTWLSANVPELLLAASLVAAEQFIEGDERIPMWKSDYKEKLMSARYDFRALVRKDFSNAAAMPDAKGSR